MFFVYVLKSLKDGDLYIGMSEDVEARLIRHNQGKVPSTKYRRPFQLLHTEEYPDRQQARKREKFLKSGPGHRELYKLMATRRVPTSSR
jgi:putative endonuclease